MPVTYRIKNWSEHFENNRSREIQRLAWCSIPNKQDGLGYRRLLRCGCGEAAYGCWVAVVLAASKCRRRDGWLTDDGTENGRPWDAEAIAIKTGFSLQTVENMLAYCSSDAVDWIEKRDCTASGCGNPAGGCDIPAPRDDGEERKEGRTTTTPAGKFSAIAEACPAAHRPSDKDIVAWAHQRGLPVDQHIDAIAATLRAEPDHRWAKFGKRLIEFAIMSAADRHERLSAPKRPVSAPNARGGVFGPGGHPTPDEWAKARDSAADAVWRAKESGEGPEAVKRAMQHARKTWGAVPKFQGKDAVDVGISLARNNPRPVVEIPGSA